MPTFSFITSKNCFEFEFKVCCDLLIERKIKKSSSIRSYAPAVKTVGYSYPRVTPGYLPPAKVAISAPAYSLNTPAYSAGIVTKYAATPAIATTAGYSGSYGSYDYDASYSRGAYYSAPAKVTKYVSTPAVTTTYATAGPTIAPIACKCLTSLSLNR